MIKFNYSTLVSYLFGAVTFIFIYPFHEGLAQKQEAPLTISRLENNFYIFSTYNIYKGKRTSANGMYVVADTGVLIIDSPWDTTQFQPLLDSIWQKHHKRAIMCLATHFHEDRTGGLEYFRKEGLSTYTSRKTDELCMLHGMKRAEFIFQKDTMLTIGQIRFETYYPGEGHTPDNIVIWFPEQKILYGGCLVKSVDDKSLGNMKDANISSYPVALRNLLLRYNNASRIIPGHNRWKSNKAVKHTLKMAKKL